MSDANAQKHVFPLRVYYEDTDAGGIVYYANYLRFAERARTEYLRSVGADHKSLMEQDDVYFTVRQCSVDYLEPAFLDDALEVHSCFFDVRGASLQAEQVVRREEHELARLNIRLACIGGNGRPIRMPKKLRDAFSADIATVGR
jgi:acyl-CoA thioester hydrolase